MSVTRSQISARITRLASAHLDDVIRLRRLGVSDAMSAIIHDLRLAGRLNTISNANTLMSQRFIRPLSLSLSSRDRDTVRTCATRCGVSASRAVNRLVELHSTLANEDLPSFAAGERDLEAQVTPCRVLLPHKLAAHLTEQAKLQGLEVTSLVIDVLVRWSRRTGMKGVRTLRAEMHRVGMTRAEAAVEDTYSRVSQRQRTVHATLPKVAYDYITEYARTHDENMSVAVSRLVSELGDQVIKVVGATRLDKYDKTVLTAKVALKLGGDTLLRLDDLAVQQHIPDAASPSLRRGFAISQYVRFHKRVQAGIPAASGRLSGEALQSALTTAMTTPEAAKYLNNQLLFTPKYDSASDDMLHAFDVVRLVENNAFADNVAIVRRAKLATTAATWHDVAASCAYREANAALAAGDIAAVSAALTAAQQHSALAEQAHEHGRQCTAQKICDRCAFLQVHPVRPTEISSGPPDQRPQDESL